MGWDDEQAAGRLHCKPAQSAIWESGDARSLVSAPFPGIPSPTFACRPPSACPDPTQRHSPSWDPRSALLNCSHLSDPNMVVNGGRKGRFSTHLLFWTLSFYRDTLPAFSILFLLRGHRLLTPSRCKPSQGLGITMSTGKNFGGSPPN